eukprot:SAG31_NODE_1201_length_9418_cov_3.410881_8_plen_341_part_00
MPAPRGGAGARGRRRPALALVALVVALGCLPQWGAGRGEDVLRRAQRTAQGRHISTLRNPYHPTKSSLLPLAEKLKRHYGVPDFHHPQDFQDFDTRGEAALARGRRAQSTGFAACQNGLLTAECTRTLRIHIDWSAFDARRAEPYASCFAVGGKDCQSFSQFLWGFSCRISHVRTEKPGADRESFCRPADWFKWNFPPSADPPCEPADLGGRTTHELWRQSSQNACDHSGAAAREPEMCDRNLDPTGQVRAVTFLVFVPTIREVRDFYREIKKRTNRESITIYTELLGCLCRRRRLEDGGRRRVRCRGLWGCSSHLVRAVVCFLVFVPTIREIRYFYREM